MSTRKEIVDRIAGAIAPLYDAREARSIALLAAAHLTGLPEAAFRTDPAAPARAEGLELAIERLAAGCPVQYVVGSTECLGHDFIVREGVLIPRPETEELVDWIVRDEGGAPLRLLDVGTGSGCIAASLAAGMPGAEVAAADISPQALAVAAENFRRLGVRVDLRCADALTDLTEVFPGPFDVVVSNPPYVPEADRESMHANVRDYEPALALFVPDDDPLRFYRAIARAGRRMLRPGGRLYFEIYHLAAEAIRTMLGEEGYTAVTLREDLYGKPRMICSRLV